MGNCFQTSGPSEVLVKSGERCYKSINSYLSGQNGPLFADDIFKYISINEQYCILIRISLKFVPKDPIDN